MIEILVIGDSHSVDAGFTYSSLLKNKFSFNEINNIDSGITNIYHRPHEIQFISDNLKKYTDKIEKNTFF